MNVIGLRLGSYRAMWQFPDRPVVSPSAFNWRGGDKGCHLRSVGRARLPPQSPLKGDISEFDGEAALVVNTNISWIIMSTSTI